MSESSTNYVKSRVQLWIIVLTMLVGIVSSLLGLITLAVNGYTELTRGRIAWEYIAIPIALSILVGMSLVFVSAWLIRKRNISKSAD